MEKNRGQGAFSLDAKRSTAVLLKHSQIWATINGCSLHSLTRGPLLERRSAPTFRQPGMWVALSNRKWTQHHSNREWHSLNRGREWVPPACWRMTPLLCCLFWSDNDDLSKQNKNVSRRKTIQTAPAGSCEACVVPVIRPPLLLNRCTELPTHWKIHLLTPLCETRPWLLENSDVRAWVLSSSEEPTCAWLVTEHISRPRNENCWLRDWIWDRTSAVCFSACSLELVIRAQSSR